MRTGVHKGVGTTGRGRERHRRGYVPVRPVAPRPAVDYPADAPTGLQTEPREVVRVGVREQPQHPDAEGVAQERDVVEAYLSPPTLQVGDGRSGPPDGCGELRLRHPSACTFCPDRRREVVTERCHI